MRGLSRHQRQQLPELLPGLIGNLDGLPYTVRDRANRQLLASYLADPQGISLYSRQALERIRLSLDLGPGQPSCQLINLDLTHNDCSRELTGGACSADALPWFGGSDDVLTALALGNLDRARALTILNPGMRNHTAASLDPQGGNLMQLAQELFTAQHNSYRQQGALDQPSTLANPSRSGHAVLVNLNYVTPQSGDVLFLSDARLAGERLAHCLDGFTLLSSGQAQIYLLNHSYGSTTAVEALARSDSDVNAIYNLGSAGINREYVPQLDAAQLPRLARDQQGRPQCFSSTARADQLSLIGITASGRLDPRELNQSFTVSAEASADQTLPAVTGHSLYPQEGVGYASAGSNSFKNIVAVTTGQVASLDQGDLSYKLSATPADHIP
ncbi:MAG: alpha/beta hydrolase [Rothia sp. (in: high G+C Gram-positive bacteria)]|nr:alpha/beta hydrolase [Rothia sp. (in: high G+C Gram-positive bacteria)]